MTKTPDEIKKGLECCKEDECFGDRENCPYTADPKLCVGVMCADALALIKQLEAERDAAVETIYEMAKCITDDVCEWCDQTECERLCMMHATERPGFKWRGVQKEDIDA